MKVYFCLDNLKGEKERILRFTEELVHNSKDAKGGLKGMQVEGVIGNRKWWVKKRKWICARAPMNLLFVTMNMKLVTLAFRR